MPTVTQFSLKLENRPGALAEVCSQLAAKAVNIEAILTSAGTVRLVLNSPETGRKVLESIGLRFTEEPAFAVRLSDRPGALGRITRKLAENNINIDYAYGSIEKGSPKALIVLGLSDLARATKILK